MAKRTTEPVERVSMPLLTRGASFTPKTLNEADRTIELVFSVGAVVRRRGYYSGEFDEEIPVSPETVDLSRLQAGAPLLESHNRYSLSGVLGVVESAELKGPKGRMEGRAVVRFDNTPEAERVFASVRNGIIRNVSVGYSVTEWEKLERKNDVPLMRAKRWIPHEVSLVAVGADAGGQVRSQGDQDEFPCVIRSIGSEEVMAKKTAEGAADDSAVRASEEQPGTTPVTGQPTESQPGQQTHGTPQPRVPQANPEPTQPSGPVQPPAERAVDPALIAQAVQKAQADERARISGIRRHAEILGLREHVEVQKLIDNGVAVGDAVLRMGEVYATRAQDPQHRADQNIRTVHVETPIGGQDAVEVLHRSVGDALLLRDPAYVPKDYKPEGRAREFVGMSMIEMGRELLRDAGVDVRGKGKGEIADILLQPGYGVRQYQRLIMRSGAASGGYHATTDFVTALGNVVYASLRRGYDETPQTFQQWAQRGTATDFREQLRIQISDMPELEPVLENGEFRRGTFIDAAERITLGTFGEIVGIGRQLIINDNIGLVTRIPAGFGRSARNLESNVVYACLLGVSTMADGKALFHTDHANLAGVAADITVTSLDVGRQAMWMQTGIDGRNTIAVEPRFLLIPPTKALITQQLLSGVYVPSAPGGVVPRDLINVVPIVEPRLQRGVSVGRTSYVGSTTAWYLVANPGSIDTLEYIYLEGNEGVYTEQRAGFDVDGVEFKARLDFGAKPMDFRGFYKNSGA